MIKKLPTSAPFGVQDDWRSKINEVIDKVNDLTINLDGQARTLIEQQTKISILEEYAHPTAKTPAENVQVDEIEQAEKWIGKLCWFSQLYGCHQHIAILKRISESGLYVTDDGELHYAYCEPVKPDDSIIYKG